MIEVKENPEIDEYLERKRVKEKMSKMEADEIKTRVNAMSKDELILAIKYFPVDVIQNEITRRMKKSIELNKKIESLYEGMKTV